MEVLRQRGLTLVLLKPFPWAEWMQPTLESRIWQIINWLTSHKSSMATQTCGHFPVFGNFLLTLLQHIPIYLHSFSIWPQMVRVLYMTKRLHWSCVRGARHPAVTYSLHFKQLWILVVQPSHASKGNKTLLWWGAIVTIICEYIKATLNGLSRFWLHTHTHTFNNYSRGHKIRKLGQYKEGNRER